MPLSTQPFMPAYWVPIPAVTAVMIRDYAGDDANDRILDLGDDYDVVSIIDSGGNTATSNHIVEAVAVRDTYEVLYNNGAAQTVRHSSMAPADTRFQGKMTGVDSTKIKLGSNGTLVDGTNKGGKTFRIRAWKLYGVLA